MWLGRGLKTDHQGLWWSEGDGCQCSHLFSTQGVSLLNANSTIHLFSVGWQMGTFQMSPKLF